MEIRQSAEDYLESILVLSKKGGGVRSIDIATRLGVSKPSVSHAMKLLREDGYIAMDRYGTVTSMRDTPYLPRCWRDLEFRQRLHWKMPARWSTISARRALRRSRRIIITLLRETKQQRSK